MKHYAVYPNGFRLIASPCVIFMFIEVNNQVSSAETSVSAETSDDTICKTFKPQSLLKFYGIKARQHVRNP